jgi:hypothetical protein
MVIIVEALIVDQKGSLAATRQARAKAGSSLRSE